MNLSNYRFIIIGSGFFGSVVAERIANKKNENVLIIEKRGHPGGNSYSEIDKETGIEVHKYGSHIFHTDDKKVWKYIRQFMKLNSYRHKVLTTYKNRVYQMPINLSTINQYYDKNLKPTEVDDFIKKETEKEGILSPQNLEEKAVSLIGRPLYEAFIKGYTQKQWETEPEKLPADIITRLPFRKDFNFEYFNDPVQGIPINGYTDVFKKMLNNNRIRVLLGTDYFSISGKIPENSYLIYTGAIDRYFNYKYGVLGWRTIDFEKEIINTYDFQGTAVMNYADADIRFTRIHEYKHYHPERYFNADKTVIHKEYSRFAKKGDELFYPIGTKENKELLIKYKNIPVNNVFFGGRLGNYHYYDMDDTIKAALLFFKKKIEKL